MRPGDLVRVNPSGLENDDGSLRTVTLTDAPYCTIDRSAHRYSFHDVWCGHGTVLLVIATSRHDHGSDEHGKDIEEDVYVVGPGGCLGWACVGEDVLQLEEPT